MSEYLGRLRTDELYFSSRPRVDECKFLKYSQQYRDDPQLLSNSQFI